jgi:hypothetical protein
MKNSMKRNRFNTLFAPLFVGILISTQFMACDSDDGNPVLKKLAAGSWSVSTVTVDGTDQTSMFTGLTITFNTDFTYTATNGNNVWPASGNWHFTDGTNTKITRSDDVEVALKDLTDTSVTLELSWDAPTYGPGRSSSIAGQHVFTMGR